MECCSLHCLTDPPTPSAHRYLQLLEMSVMLVQAPGQAIAQTVIYARHSDGGGGMYTDHALFMASIALSLVDVAILIFKLLRYRRGVRARVLLSFTRLDNTRFGSDMYEFGEDGGDADAQWYEDKRPDPNRTSIPLPMPYRGESFVPGGPVAEGAAAVNEVQPGAVTNYDAPTPVSCADSVREGSQGGALSRLSRSSTASGAPSVWSTRLPPPPGTQQPSLLQQSSLRLAVNQTMKAVAAAIPGVHPLNRNTARSNSTKSSGQHSPGRGGDSGQGGADKSRLGPLTRRAASSLARSPLGRGPSASLQSVGSWAERDSVTSYNSGGIFRNPVFQKSTGGGSASGSSDAGGPPSPTTANAAVAGGWERGVGVKPGEEDLGDAGASGSSLTASSPEPGGRPAHPRQHASPNTGSPHAGPSGLLTVVVASTPDGGVAEVASTPSPSVHPASRGRPASARPAVSPLSPGLDATPEIKPVPPSPRTAAAAMAAATAMAAAAKNDVSGVNPLTQLPFSPSAADSPKPHTPHHALMESDSPLPSPSLVPSMRPPARPMSAARAPSVLPPSTHASPAWPVMGGAAGHSGSAQQPQQAQQPAGAATSTTTTTHTGGDGRSGRSRPASSSSSSRSAARFAPIPPGRARRLTFDPEAAAQQAQQGSPHSAAEPPPPRMTGSDEGGTSSSVQERVSAAGRLPSA